MHEEVPLFAFDEDAPDPVGSDAPAPAATWQIDLLRKALDARGLVEMNERQKVIEEHAARPVASLRDLTSAEALQVLSKLGEQPSSGNSSTESLWDQRDEDTWIDRL